MENHHLEWIFPWKIVIFHSYVKLPEGIPDMEYMDSPAHLRNSSHEEPSSQTMSNRARQPLLAVDGKDEGGKPVKLKMKPNIQTHRIHVCYIW